MKNVHGVCLGVCKQKITAKNLITDYAQPVQDSNTGQPVEDSQYGIAVQDSQYRTSSTAQPVQDSQYRTASTG
jgi:hypothetical protein